MSSRFQPRGNPQSTYGAAFSWYAVETATPADRAYQTIQNVAYAQINTLIQGIRVNGSKYYSTDTAQQELLNLSLSVQITAAVAAVAGVTPQYFVGQTNFVAGLAAVNARIAQGWSTTT